MDKLKRSGYSKVYFWIDKPHKVYKPHLHLRATKIVVVRGSMKLTMMGYTKNYKAGDSINVPKEIKHSAIIGSHGREFVEGSR